MTRLAVFRCDASTTIGAGHFIRCRTLSDALAERGWTCRFLTLPNSAQVVEKLAGPSVAEVVETECADNPTAIRGLAPNGCDLFVLDSYRLGYAYEQAVSAWTGYSLVVDDRPLRTHIANMLLDPTLGRDPDEYVSLVPKGTQLLLGPNYALLRPAFFAARLLATRRRKHNASEKKILVALGGGTASEALGTILEGCRISDVTAQLHVVAEGSGDLPAQLGAMKVVCHDLRRDIHSLMADCDLAIGAGGGSAWERCCLGLPTLLVTLADNQRDVSTALARAGAASAMGAIGSLTPRAVADNLKELVGDPARLRKMGARAAAVCDGLGARRVAGLLSPETAKGGDRVTLRPASLADAALMFAWQQIPSVRRHTPNPQPPTWETHVNWLKHRLEEGVSGAFSIIVSGGRDVGVLRLDSLGRERWGRQLDVGSMLVSVYLETNSRGRSIALAALRAAKWLMPEATLYAEVRSGNEASDRLFRNAGYSELSPGLFRKLPEARLVGCGFTDDLMPPCR